MGHYVLARALSFRTGDVSIKITGPSGHYGTADIILTEAIKSTEALRAYLKRRIIVLYAGGIAETLPDHNSPLKKANIDEANEIFLNPERGAGQDFAKMRELLRVLRNITYLDTDPSDKDAVQAELDTLNDALFNRAVELVEQFAETITGLGGHLADQVLEPGKEAKLEAAHLESLPAVRQIIPMTP